MIYIIAGPNGAGKTTFANKFLPEFVRCIEFLNADLITAGKVVRKDLTKLDKKRGAAYRFG